MAKLEWGEGNEVPTVFEDVLGVTLVDPGTDYVCPLARINKGFFMKSDTAGTFQVITLRQYLDAGGNQYRDPTAVERDAVITDVFNAVNYVELQLAAYQWSDVALVWVDATNAASLDINIGLY